MNKENMICTAFFNGEPGAHKNATIELLAIALFKDTRTSHTSQWCRQTHDVRQYFRRIARGELELP